MLYERGRGHVTVSPEHTRPQLSSPSLYSPSYSVRPHPGLFFALVGPLGARTYTQDFTGVTGRVTDA